MPAPLVYIIGGAALIFLTLFLQRRGLLISFLLNAVAGLLTAVLAVCLSPLLRLNMTLNLFTGSAAVFLGPFGVAGVVFVALLWGL